VLLQFAQSLPLFFLWTPGPLTIPPLPLAWLQSSIHSVFSINPSHPGNCYKFAVKSRSIASRMEVFGRFFPSFLVILGIFFSTVYGVSPVRPTFQGSFCRFPRLEFTLLFPSVTQPPLRAPPFPFPSRGSPKPFLRLCIKFNVRWSPISPEGRCGYVFSESKCKQRSFPLHLPLFPSQKLI